MVGGLAEKEERTRVYPGVEEEVEVVGMGNGWASVVWVVNDSPTHESASVVLAMIEIDRW